MRAIIAVLISASLLAGCQKDGAVATADEPAAGTQAAEEVSLTPEQLGEVGAQIAKNPENAKSILEGRGLNEASFEKAVRKVTEDPEASKKYAEAYRQHS
jgi:hypothetical protein